MRILVTGGTGFVGSNIVKNLVDGGHEVTITGTNAEAMVAGVYKILNLHLDETDWSHIKEMDVVFHQAANNDTQSLDAQEMFKANLFEPLSLFTNAYDLGCRNFVFASSTAIYGDNPAPYVEDGNILPNPMTFYGDSKLEFENKITEWNKDRKANIVGLRYCNIYGPGEYHKGKRSSMIYQLIRQMQGGKRPKIFKHGEQKRDWVYIKDVVEANMLAWKYAESGNSGIFNIGSGTATTFNDIISIINDNLETNLETEYIDCSFKDSYQTHTECNIKKAEAKIGFRPQYDITNGITEFISLLV